jgi:MFS family permease
VTRLRLVTGETFASLRIRNFRLFFVGQGISQVGTWASMVAQTLLVLHLTDSGVALGLLAAAHFGPVLVLGAWAGVIADRSDKRRLLTVLQCLSMLQSFAMAGLAFMGSPPVGAIYAVAVLGGLVTAFDNPTRRSFVVEMVPADHVTNAVSLNSALMTGARVVGPAAAGVLVVTVGYGWTFFIDGLSTLAVIAGLLRMRPAELRPAPVLERGRRQVRAGLAYASRVPQLRVPLVMMAVVGVLAFNFQVVFPLYVIKDLGGTDGTFTLLYSVVSLGAFLGALAVARRVHSTVRLASLSAVAFGAAMTLLALAPNQQVAFAVGPLIGVTSISFMTISTALVQTVAVPEMRGRVLALQAIVFLGSTPLGGPLVGWVAEQFGARWAIALGAAGCLFAGLWGLRFSDRVATDAAAAPVPAISGAAVGTLDTRRGEQIDRRRGWNPRRPQEIVGNR